MKAILIIIFLSFNFINAQKNNLVWQGTGYANKTTTFSQVNETDWIENDGVNKYYYKLINSDNNEFLLGDKNRTGVLIKLKANNCSYKDLNTDWKIIYLGKWIHTEDESFPTMIAQKNSVNATDLNSPAISIQKIEAVDEFLSKIGHSNRTISNIYFRNESLFDYNYKSNEILNLIENKKQQTKILKELQIELNDFKRGLHSIEVIKGHYEKACGYEVNVIPCDEKLIQKLKRKDLFFDNGYNPNIDYNLSIPLIYEEKSLGKIVGYFLLYRVKESSLDKNGNAISNFLFEQELSSDHFIKIQKILKDSKPLHELEKKSMVQKVTGLNDRFFEIERQMNEASQLNQKLSSNFTFTEKGGLFVGSMQNNLYSGFGMLFNTSGDTIFIGEWNKNYPDLDNGMLFQYLTTDNEVYIVDNSNIFISYSPNGDTYCGQTKDNKRNGKGIYIWKNDDYYSGDWVSSERTGIGVLRRANSDVYSGNFYNNKENGYGTYVWGPSKWEGDKYEGEWVNGQRTGWGKYTSRNGITEEGKYENGTLIKSKETIEQEKLAEEKSKEEELQKISEENNQEINFVGCDIVFSRPKLKFKNIDNRKLCCFCAEKYAKYSNSGEFEKCVEEVYYLTETLYLHHKKIGANDEHVKNDLNRLENFITNTYLKNPLWMGLVILPNVHYNVTIPFSSAFGEQKLGETTRDFNLYKVEKFCGPKCEYDCSRMYNCPCK